MFKRYSFSDVGLTYGNPKASVDIVFFTSRSCSKCHKFFGEVRDDIRQLVERGSIRIQFKFIDRDLYNVNFSNISLTDLDSLYDECYLRSLPKIDNHVAYEAIVADINNADVVSIPCYFINGERHLGLNRDDFLRYIDNAY